VVDGTATANGPINTASTSAMYLGGARSIGNYWNGQVDEVHFAPAARSANWLLTEYNNQSAPLTFSPLGPEVGL
jgi:hypothetical protein